MPLNVPEGDAIVAFRHTITGDSEEMLCTFGVILNDPRSQTDQVVVNALFDAWKAAMDTSLTAQCTMIGATMQRKAALGYITTSSTTGTVSGTSSGTPLPPNCAALIEKQTDRGGRSGKGRCFLPGFSETGVDGAGMLLSANLTQLNNDLAAFFAAANAIADVFNLAVFHQTDNVSPNPDSITGLVADPKIATQRRRLR